MRLASIHLGTQIVPALIEAGRVLPLASDRAAPSVREIIGLPDPAGWTAQQRAAAAQESWLDYGAVRFALPVSDAGKILCVGLNYLDHAREGGRAVPTYPALFIRTLQSLVPAGSPLVRPIVSTSFDYEAELAVVIGRRCRHVSEANALEHVFGYTLFNDGTVRDYQRMSAQWTPGKNFDRTGSFGPAVVSQDELPAGATGLRITCTVNGALVQDANTADMIFPVARLVAILSEVMALEPGDVIATGTPAGVGFARQPPLWLKDGDLVTVAIEGVGQLSNGVIDEIRD
jgi:2-keto-4-pentenoate hydratase/2-oxohepta-3-ene-1,7-dioic acid hydratase in catechol pathway